MIFIEKIEDLGEVHPEMVTFADECWKAALIGVAHDGRAVYDMDMMIELKAKEFEDYARSLGEVVDGPGEPGASIELPDFHEQAIEWIEYNTLRSLPYTENAPIVMDRILLDKDDVKDLEQLCEEALANGFISDELWHRIKDLYKLPLEATTAISEQEA